VLAFDQCGFGARMALGPFYDHAKWYSFGRMIGDTVPVVRLEKDASVDPQRISSATRSAAPSRCTAARSRVKSVVHLRVHAVRTDTAAKPAGGLARSA
jgi:hypothetical protein